MAFLLILDHIQENKKEPKDNFYKRHFSVAAMDKNICTIFENVIKNYLIVNHISLRGGLRMHLRGYSW